ncbi:hypothetical protein KEM48_009133 [Puccinia striiformis f. sp. tritici PST-130]|nr:hypothetical protein KEM48_009133 [Puccinia striiformis f. sp. tritici PST-130]
MTLRGEDLVQPSRDKREWHPNRFQQQEPKKEQQTTTKQLLKKSKNTSNLSKLTEPGLEPIADLLESLSNKQDSAQKSTGRIHGSPVSQTEETEQHAVKLDGGGYQIELDCLTILMNLISLNPTSFEPSNIKLITSNILPQFRKLYLLETRQTLLVPTSSITVLFLVRSEFILRYLNFVMKNSDFSKMHSSTQNQVNKADRRRKNTEPKTGTREKSITTMPTKVEELNQFWTGEVSSGTNEKKYRNERASKKKKKSKLVNEDGSTGIFDDDLTDSNEDNSALSSERHSKTKQDF